jgi:hypothetical protein
MAEHLIFWKGAPGPPDTHHVFRQLKICLDLERYYGGSKMKNFFSELREFSKFS